MDKKLLVWGALAVVVLIVIIGVYMMMQNNQKTPTSLEQNDQPNTVTQPSDQDTTPQNDTNQPTVDVQVGGVTTTEGGGGLLVCVVRCGDKVCQKTLVCPKGDLNCVCDETPESCPEDCI